jgi:hypothetical protein
MSSLCRQMRTCDARFGKPVTARFVPRVEVAQRADLGVVFAGQECSGVFSVGVSTRGHTTPTRRSRLTRRSSRTVRLSTMVRTGAHVRHRQMATRRPHDEIDPSRFLALPQHDPCKPVPDGASTQCEAASM